MSLFGGGDWGQGKHGVWEFKVSNDHMIFYSRHDAWKRQQSLGYNAGLHGDEPANVQYAVIHVRPAGATEWGWAGGYHHRSRRG